MKLVSAYHNLYGEITDIIKEDDDLKISLKRNENIFISFLTESSNINPILKKRAYIFCSKGKHFRNDEKYLSGKLEKNKKIPLFLIKTYYKDILEYNVNITGKIIIKIYDIKGSLVKKYERLIRKKGRYYLSLKDLAKGIYFIKINLPERKIMRKLIFLK